VWDHVHTALSPQGDELSPRGSWGICVLALPEGLTIFNLTWTNLGKDVEAVVKNCHGCQIGKKVRYTFGDLTEKLAKRPIDWNIVDVDLIGPLTIKTPSGKKEFLVLTMVDPSTGLRLKT
jgi:hypothetical protein